MESKWTVYQMVELEKDKTDSVGWVESNEERRREEEKKKKAEETKRIFDFLKIHRHKVDTQSKH